MVDSHKRQQLMQIILNQPEHVEGRALITPAEFFDGNDELGSIGCNLVRHPGLTCFRDAISRIEASPGVDQVWLQIYDYDEGDWPFCENVLVVGEAAAADIEEIAATISPSEIAEMQIRRRRRRRGAVRHYRRRRRSDGGRGYQQRTAR